MSWIPTIVAYLTDRAADLYCPACYAARGEPLAHDVRCDETHASEPCDGCGARLGCGGAWAPGWTEADGGACPSCGVELRVVVDDERAYAEVSAGTT